MTTIPPPFEHQKRSIEYFANKQRTLDTSDPGTGKTRVYLEVFAARRAKGSGCMLVIAPKSLLEAAWAEDIMKFTPWLSYSVAYASNREEAFEADADVYITNIDAARWLAEREEQFFAKFDTLCMDEITAFKHRTSGRSKAMQKIVKHFMFRHGMSGTLNPNGITDAWHPLYLIDDGKRLGVSFFAFRSATQQAKQVGPLKHMKQWTDKPGAEIAVGQLIADISMRHSLQECIDLPENNIRQVSFNPSPEMLRAYEQMRIQLMTEIKDEEVLAANAAVLLGKLLQISSGAVYSSEDEYVVVDDSRYELIADLILERPHTVVFFLWTHQKEEVIKMIRKKDRNAEIAVMDSSTPERMRNEYVKGFQNGFFRTLLCHPLTAAHGLTLTRANATIWCSPTSNLEWWKQGMHRILRAGQDKRTETIVITARNTIEPMVYEQKLLSKALKMDNLLEILEAA